MQRIAIILVALAFTLTACKSPAKRPSESGGIEAANASAPATPFSAVIIDRQRDPAGNMVNQQMTIRDQAEIAKLMTYFPELRTDERGEAPGGWQPDVTLRFKRASVGPDIRVRTNYKVWTKGTGDWPVKQAFVTHLNRLFANQP